MGLSVVIDDDLSETASAFIELNEFALRYHLCQLDRVTNDFELSYRILEKISKVPQKEKVDPNTVWNALDDAMDQFFYAAQTLEPAIKRSREETSKKFSRLRAEVLSYLLGLNAEGVSELKGIRNRLTHSYEDFDDWYILAANEGFRGQLNLRQRKLFWNKVDLHVAEQGVIMGYDVKGGVFHTLGEATDIHGLCRMMEAIRCNIPAAHRRLTKIAKSETELTIL